MPSNKDVVFSVFDQNGSPLTGLTPTWNYCYDMTSGTEITSSQPQISEIGGGFYKVLSSVVIVNQRIIGNIDCSEQASPRYLTFDLRYEDTQDIRDAVGLGGSNVVLQSSTGVYTVPASAPTAAQVSAQVKSDLGLGANKVILQSSDGVYTVPVSAANFASAVQSAVGLVGGNMVLQSVDGSYTAAPNASDVATQVAGLSVISTIESSVKSGSNTAIGILTNPSYGLAAIDSDTELARKLATNSSKIINNQLIIYDDNGSTIIARFNLKDDTGQATSNKIYERVKTNPNS
jgi:hypothetical protein